MLGCRNDISACGWLAAFCSHTPLADGSLWFKSVFLFLKKGVKKIFLILNGNWVLVVCPPHTLDLSLESAQNTTSFNLISNLQRVEDRPMSPEMGSRLGFTPLVALISCKEHAFICFCNYKGSSLLKKFVITVNFI